jgi:NAD(P)-dependent dehydrogenase (short-subunit alcohol dehydrogenase family)
MRPLFEQVILVTGATDGLGKAVTMQLARSGATLLLHGRDETSGQQALEEIRAQTGNTRLHWYRADFSSLAQVRAMAARLAREQERLDVLLNNVGIGSKLPGGGRRQESEDGYELRFAVNYLAPFLLTRLLVPMLRQSAPARIVNVASAAQAPIDFGDVMLEHHYHGGQAYSQSKLALVMFTFDLAEELAGSGVTVNCLHPATYMPTKIVLAARGRSVSTIEEGVQATLRLITAAELDQSSGRYFNGLREARAERARPMIGRLVTNSGSSRSDWLGSPSLK